MQWSLKLPEQVIKSFEEIIGNYIHFRRRQWHPTPALLPGKSHGWRSLVGCSPWGREESDMAERLHFHFSLSCIGEGNGNPLQCSCLENPRDGGAWWATVYGVAQNQTQLKQLSSSSNCSVYWDGVYILIKFSSQSENLSLTYSKISSISINLSLLQTFKHIRSLTHLIS